MSRQHGDRANASAEITVPAEERTPVAPPPKPRRVASRLPIAFGILGIFLGLGGAGLAAWTYSESQREFRRLASDIAQLRVSLDLYARGAGQAAASSDSSEGLADLEQRLAILEQNWRGGTSTAPATPAPATTASTSGNEDCLPSGMRLLVAAGDNYPICGQPASVEVSQVDNGFIVLADGTAVASGGTMPLPNSACTIGVTSGGDEGLTGYAEIRVTC